MDHEQVTCKSCAPSIHLAYHKLIAYFSCLDITVEQEGEPLSLGGIINLPVTAASKGIEDQLIKLKYKEQTKMLVPLDSTVPWYEEVGI